MLPSPPSRQNPSAVEIAQPLGNPKMPEVYVHAVEGRTVEQKRALVKDMKPATEEDWYAEYLAPILAVRVVDDMDAAMEHIARYGSQHTDAIVTEDKARAERFLRASHRELDPDKTLPYRPYHKHTRRLYLKPGEIVKVDVEIWPTSMVFKKGNRIRLDVQPRDGFGSQSYLHYHADYNTGTNTIYAGGKYESYLLLPVIPKKA